MLATLPFSACAVVPRAAVDSFFCAVVLRYGSEALPKRCCRGLGSQSLLALTRIIAGETSRSLNARPDASKTSANVAELARGGPNTAVLVVHYLTPRVAMLTHVSK